MTKALLTGSNGFLGKHISQVLSKSTDLITLSRSEGTIKADLSKEIVTLPVLDLVVHCAGKAHFIPKTKEEIFQFFQVNVKGTENLLLSLERAPLLPKWFVFISSVSVYGLEIGDKITEDFPLLAEDPYGRSKVLAEELVLQWCRKNQIICTILRLPLLVGNDPTGNLKAIIIAIKKGYYFNIGEGKAKKSMVLAEDVAIFIPSVARIGGVFNLTDGNNPDLKTFSLAISTSLGKNPPLYLPLFVAKLFGYIGDLSFNVLPVNSGKINKITNHLTFDDAKARNSANWNAKSVVTYIADNSIF